MPDPVEWIFDAGDPETQGFRIGDGRESLEVTPRIAKDTTLRRRIRVQRRSQKPGFEFEDMSLTGATVEVGIGDPGLAPTSGTFDLSYDGNSTGLTDLDFDTTAAELETALNANPAVSGDGSLDVEKAGNTFTITFRTAGAKELLVSDPVNLQPQSVASVIRRTQGDANTREVQTLTIVQIPWGYQNSWTAMDAPAVTSTQVTAGSATAKQVQSISLSPAPLGGTFRFTATRAQQWQISCVGNNGTKEVDTVVCTADSGGSLQGDYFDLYDDAGVVRVWIDVNAAGTGTPETPPGGRLIEVDVSTGATASAVATAVQAALDGDSKFVAAKVTTTKVQVTAASAGLRSAPADDGSGSFTVARVTAGTNGDLAGTTVVLSDANGTVGVWFDVLGNSPSVACDRFIEVDIAGDASATAVAAALETAIDADAQFTASDSSTSVIVTDAAVGDRQDTTDDGDSDVTVRIIREGCSISKSVPYNVDPSTFGSLTDDLFEVTKPEDFKWQLTAASVGAWTSVAAVDEELVFPSYVDGVLALNTANLQHAFNLATGDEIDGVMEVKVTFSGEEPEVVYLGPVKLARNLLTADSLTVPGGSVPQVFFGGQVTEFLPTTTGYAGGGGTDLDSIVTLGKSVPRLVCFNHSTDGLRFYKLQSGTDAEDSPNIIRPDDYAATTNEKVWLSVF